MALKFSDLKQTRSKYNGLGNKEMVGYGKIKLPGWYRSRIPISNFLPGQLMN